MCKFLSKLKQLGKGQGKTIYLHKCYQLVMTVICSVDHELEASVGDMIVNVTIYDDHVVNVRNIKVYQIPILYYVVSCSCSVVILSDCKMSMRLVILMMVLTFAFIEVKLLVEECSNVHLQILMS